MGRRTTISFWLCLVAIGLMVAGCGDRGGAQSARPDSTVVTSTEAELPMPEIYTVDDDRINAQAGVPFAIALDAPKGMRWTATRHTGMNEMADRVVSADSIGLTGGRKQYLVFSAFRTGRQSLVLTTVPDKGDSAETDSVRFTVDVTTQ